MYEQKGVKLCWKCVCSSEALFCQTGRRSWGLVQCCFSHLLQEVFFLKTAKPVKPELHVKDAFENNVGLLCYNFFEGDF